MSRFPKLLTGLFRDFRNSYNEGVDKIDSELDLQKKRVDDLIKGTPQPSEIVDARGGHPVLRDRLNQVDAHLAQKATKEELSLKVSKEEQKIFDILTTPVSYYSTLELPEGKIMQGFYFAQNGNAMFANIADGGSPESFTVYRLTSTGKMLDSMTLSQFGHGTLLGIEEIGTEVYIWTNIETVSSTNTLTRVKYIPGATYTPSSPEIENYSKFSIEGKVYPSIHYNYIIYCRGLGSGNSWKVEKRLLDDVKNGIDNIIQEITIPTSHLYLQGMAVDGDIIYWLSGDNNGVNYPIKLTTFDFNTGIILHDLSVDFGGNSKGIVESNYREPEGLFLYNDGSGAKSLFVGMVTGDDKNRNNKVFAYHSLLNANKFLGIKLQDVPINNSPGWVTAELKNGATIGWSYPLQYRKITGGKVQLRGCVIPSATGTVVATLPYEYKPRKMQRRIVAGDGGSNPSRVSIDNGTGDITVNLGTSITSVWLDIEIDINPE